MNPLVIVRTQLDKGGTEVGLGLWLWCPGCEEAHCPRAALPDGSRPDSTRPYWGWNGRTDSAFTIEPSLLTWTSVSRCHSFIRNGRWEFLTDSTHPLAGQIVPMVPVPDWLC